MSEQVREIAVASLHGFRDHPFLRETPNVPIPGYLYSMRITDERIRRRDKPVWLVDVCAALPDDRDLRGGAAR